MSIRVYHPRVSRARRSRAFLLILSWVAAIAFVALQIAYPLVDGEQLRLITIATVYTGACAAVLHGWTAYGFRYAFFYLVISMGFGAVIELIGVHSGWPFGEYSYNSTLGFQFAEVPLLVPFAWVMMAHPVLTAARILNQRWAPVIGGWALMAWDAFLDPLMVNAGHWRWARTSPDLPGIPGIPLSNFAGWLLSGLVLMFILDQVLTNERRTPPASIGPAALVLLWVYASGIVGNFFFFDRPGVALAGGVLLGVVAIPYASVLWWSRR